MTRETFFIALLLIGTAAFVRAADKPNAKPSAPAVTTTNTPSVQVIAYYFHGTVRCVECLKIERKAREVIEENFKTELADKRLVFKPVNYEQPENTHFLLDYKLPCPSLVLVRRQDGKDEKWKLLGDTWKRVEDPERFDRYVEDEVDKYLRDAE